MPVLDFLEIVCFPGRFLYYFAKEFGYRVFGLDFVPEAAFIPEWLAELGVEAQVTVANFFDFQPKRRFDVVASFGFVEHFPNWEEVLEGHLALLNPGGTLIIEFPNFRYGQYWLRRCFNPANLSGHCLEVMDPALWSCALEERGLELIYCGYYQTFDYWGGLTGRGWKRWCRRVLIQPVKYVKNLINYFQIDYPNRYFSPFAFIIARKP